MQEEEERSVSYRIMIIINVYHFTVIAINLYAKVCECARECNK